jgi:hypothetical protein
VTDFNTCRMERCLKICICNSGYRSPIPDLRTA